MSDFSKHAPAFFALVVTALLLVLAPLSPRAAPRAEETGADGPSISVTVAPETRTIIYRKVALLPVRADDPQLAADLTRALYEALGGSKKYRLLAPDLVREKLEALHKAAKTESRLEPVSIGRKIRARGIIEAEVIPDGNTIAGPKDPDCLFTLKIRMIDSRTGKTAWSVSARCPGTTNPRILTRDRVRNLARLSVDNLIKTMVAKGDIFSPLLPRPRIIAARGELRATRLILQPDPPYIYSNYLLLGTEDPQGVFTPRGKTLHNNQAPLTLADSDLKDGTTYYYTVIGLTKDGLANVPEPPRPITTSGAPEPISTLHVSGNSLRHIRLFWEPSQDPYVTGYVIYRSTAMKGPFTRIAEINDRDRQSYIDYGSSRNSSYGSLKDDTRYFYRLTTRNKVGVESKPTPVVSARTKGAPPPPDELRAIDNQAGKIPLFWEPAADPDIRGYAIFRSEDREGPFSQIEFVRGRESQQYTDTGSWTSPLRNNTTYCYQVKSVNVLDIPSRESATVSATTKAAPSAVAGIRVSDNLFREVELQWKANPEPDITTYEIFRGTTADELKKIATVKASTTRYVDSGLRDGTTYWYRIQAVDSDGLEGDFSPPVNAATKPGPKPPADLSARLTDKGILLQWSKSPSPDTDHYEIFTMGFLNTRIGETRGTEFLYTEEMAPGEELRFQVRAVDTHDLASDYSQPAVLRIPEQNRDKNMIPDQVPQAVPAAGD